MLKRVLVANRGEIAVRIIRECLDIGAEPVSVYSTTDSHSLHKMIVPKSLCVGGPKASESYLNISNIIEAAKLSGCDSIHPGYGFLSENSTFAEECTKAGLKFIGPDAGVIKKMGNKSAARELMKSAGIPTVPGSDGPVNTAEEAADIGDCIGYPVLIKASAGGGGKGMRRAYSRDEVMKAFSEASLEAENNFGNGEMYVEKLIENPRHIEFQILADKYGNTIHLGERDCSIQRRNQKFLEETPAWGLSKTLRNEMGKAAVKAAKAADYENAGTIEFVVDKNNNFYFIEMNTRLQVEHPITEAVTGVNIVKEQLKIASGIELDIKQEDVVQNGHALECRITAEKVFKNFMPNPGKIDFIHFPAGHGIRVDSALYSGCEISPYYDSMVAKIITNGKTRLDAIRKMRRALGEMVIQGVDTTLPVQYLLMYNHDFLRGQYDTDFVDKNLSSLLKIYKAAGSINESI